MILDTTFLIDLQREFRDGTNGPAGLFLTNNRRTRFQISVITATEFLEGFEKREEGEIFIKSYPWVPVDATIARKVAEYRRGLRRIGRMIGDFDLLIAATAAVREQPLVTADARHFRRLESLEVIAYRE